MNDIGSYQHGPVGRVEVDEEAPANHLRPCIGWKLLVTFPILLLAAYSTCRPSPMDLDSLKRNFESTSDLALEKHNAIIRSLRALESKIDGDIYFSATDGFTKAAQVWTLNVPPPSAVIQVENTKDVQLVLPVLVDLSKRFEIPFRIRSGGHHKLGYSTAADGIVLSLVRLNTIKLDSLENEAAIATIGPGVTVNQFLNDVFVPHGYAGVLGYCGSVAEGGFVLGGGIGMQSRMYGLGLDSARGFSVILVDGSLVTASCKENPDLFWALRGAGGGSFGVVTEISYQVHKASDLFHVLSLELDANDMATFLFRLGEIERSIPGNVIAMYDTVGRVNLGWTGRHEADVMNKNKSLEDLVDSIVPSNFLSRATRASLQWSSMLEDGKLNASVTWGDHVWRAACWTGFLHPENNTAEVWDDIMQHFEAGFDLSPHLLPDIELWGGAIHDASSNATAFPYRSAIYNLGVLLMIPADCENPEDTFERESAAVDQWWPAVGKYLTGSYVNYPSVSLGEDYPQAFWGDNLPRLSRIKRRYDPENLMRFPMSVPLHGS